MDIMLERILSLIPRKPDGKFVHGAKKEFCDKVGISNITILSQWLSGFSRSYETYLYQIADAYAVSVKWLKGETDDPRPYSAETPEADPVWIVKSQISKMNDEQLLESLRTLMDALDKKREK